MEQIFQFSSNYLVMYFSIIYLFYSFISIHLCAQQYLALLQWQTVLAFKQLQNIKIYIHMNHSWNAFYLASEVPFHFHIWWYMGGNSGENSIHAKEFSSPTTVVERSLKSKTCKSAVEPPVKSFRCKKVAIKLESTQLGTFFHFDVWFLTAKLAWWHVGEQIGISIGGENDKDMTNQTKPAINSQ